MAEKNKVTRITATDDTPKRETVSKTAAVTTEVDTKTSKLKTVKPVRSKKLKTPKGNASTEPSKNVFVRIGRYFKGAWFELRQVRWPNRRATWSLTFAVLLFTAFFVVLILLLDAFFQYIFNFLIA